MALAYTYDDKSIREDLLGIITNLDFKETQLFSGLADGSADSVNHEWLKDTLKTPGANAQVEGFTATSKNPTNPTRLTNWTQVVSNVFAVSDTERAVNNAGFKDRFAYETTKAMKEFKQDVEFALMRGSLVCGTGSLARSMRGVKFWLSNYTTHSGVTLIESMLNDYMQAVWDDGTQVNAIYAPMSVKRRISAFTAGATKNFNQDDRRLVNAIDVYQSDVASNVKLFAHRFIYQSGDHVAGTAVDMIGINEDMFRKAWLRKPKLENLAKTGDNTLAMIVGELTLECLHEDSGFLTRAIY